jgi:ribonuclease E
MGGTMLGVAPQAGGLLPPQVPATVPVPLVPGTDTAAAPAPLSEATSEQVAELSGEGPADPYAGTYEMPTSEPPAVGASRDMPAPAPALHATRPLEAAPSTSLPDAAAAQAAPDPARRRPLAATAALPVQPESAARADLEPVAESLVPPRLRTLDVALLVCTLGLYGLVLWAKRRKRRRPNA